MAEEPGDRCVPQEVGGELYEPFYPFKNMDDAAGGLKACPMAEVDRITTAHGNARKLFKLS